MVKISINGKPIEVNEGTTIFRAAEQAGVPLPHLCYHAAFVPEGSCRICLIEIEGLPKLELACATVVREGMKIATESASVREARRSVLEFLLAEHPLDCPICDKAGECKLQNYYQDYGLTESVFREAKKKREKKVNIGEKLILDRERCILCTRCVRFLAEVTKTHELGVFERGLRSEISTYNGEFVQNGYSGNLVDLCPVGAITDVEFRFKTRPWFLVKGESICPLCSRGCNIYVDYHPGFPRVPGSAKVYRIRPRKNEAVNGHWLCDSGRYGFVDREFRNRCEKLVWKKGEKEIPLSWDKILMLLAEKIMSLHFMKKTDRIGLVLNTGLTNEELFLIKKIFRDDLNVGKIFFVDPQAGAGDGFLLQAERSPNARGAREVGFDIRSVRPAELAGIKILMIFGQFLTNVHSLADLKLALDRIETKVLVTSRSGGLESLVDFVLPAAVVAEKAGSLTNADGRIQKFRPAVVPCGDIRPEWNILVELAKELKLNSGYYGRFSEAEAVFKELSRERPFFGTPT